jgi:hypothetical protein
VYTNRWRSVYYHCAVGRSLSHTDLPSDVANRSATVLGGEQPCSSSAAAAVLAGAALIGTSFGAVLRLIGGVVDAPLLVAPLARHIGPRYKRRIVENYHHHHHHHHYTHTYIPSIIDIVWNYCVVNKRVIGETHRSIRLD